MADFIFNIGMNCSGTTSLCEALNLLGFPSLHLKTNDGKLLKSIIQNNLEKKQKLFDPYHKNFNGFCDFSGEEFYEQLYYCYPNSKFIFTTRPFADWLKSRIKLEEDIYHTDHNRHLSKREIFALELRFKTHYFYTTENIRSFFQNKPNQFLELKICEGEGWDPLCKFLSVDVSTYAFPYLNKSVYNN